MSISSYEIPHSRHPEGRNEKNDVHFSLKTPWEAVHRGALELLHILLNVSKSQSLDHSFTWNKGHFSVLFI